MRSTTFFLQWQTPTLTTNYFMPNCLMKFDSLINFLNSKLTNLQQLNKISTKCKRFSIFWL